MSDFGSWDTGPWTDSKKEIKYPDVVWFCECGMTMAEFSGKTKCEHCGTLTNNPYKRTERTLGLRSQDAPRFGGIFPSPRRTPMENSRVIFGLDRKG